MSYRKEGEKKEKNHVKRSHWKNKKCALYISTSGPSWYLSATEWIADENCVDCSYLPDSSTAAFSISFTCGNIQQKNQSMLPNFWSFPASSNCSLPQIENSWLKLRLIK